MAHVEARKEKLSAWKEGGEKSEVNSRMRDGEKRVVP